MAEFLLDQQGQPTFLQLGSKKHWKILLKLVNAPTDAASVTYKLHDSYWDPSREVIRPSAPPPSGEPPSFAEEITSYGDYLVRASVSGSPLAGKRLEGQLSELLRASPPPPQADPEAIKRAIEELRDH